MKQKKRKPLKHPLADKLIKALGGKSPDDVSEETLQKAARKALSQQLKEQEEDGYGVPEWVGSMPDKDGNIYPDGFSIRKDLEDADQQIMIDMDLPPEATQRGFSISGRIRETVEPFIEYQANGEPTPLSKQKIKNVLHKMAGPRDITPQIHYVSNKEIDGQQALQEWHEQTDMYRPPLHNLDDLLEMFPGLKLEPEQRRVFEAMFRRGPVHLSALEHMIENSDVLDIESVPMTYTFPVKGDKLK